MADIRVKLPNGQEGTIPEENLPMALKLGAQVVGPGAKLERGPELTLEGLDRALGQGFTFGYGDEIAAGLGATADRVIGGKPWSDAYRERLATERKSLHDTRQAAPVLSTAAEVGGALTVPMGAAPKATRLADRIRQAIASGSKYGALSGFGGSDGDLVDRLGGAAIGAGIGAGAGVVGPTLGKIATGVTQRIADATADTPIGAMLGHLPGITLPGDDRGTQMVLAKLEQEGLTLEEALARIEEGQRLGKPLTLADVGGPLTRRLADHSMIPSTAAGSKASEMLQARSADAGGRINSDLTRTTGLSGDVLQVSEALTRKRAADAAPLYEKAYAAGSGGVADPRILGILQLPHFKDAFARAKRIAKLEGRDLPEIMNEKGEPVKVPDLQTLDYVKRGLDDHLFSGKVSGALGRTEERALKQVRQEYLAALDSAVPEYAQARAAYAGPTELLEAMEAGTKFAKSNPQEIQQMLTRDFPTPAEREHYLLGAIDRIRRGIADTNDGADVYRRVFGDQTKREQLRTLFGNPERFADFEAAMAAEHKMRITADTVRGNSKSMERSIGLAELGAAPGSGLDRMMMGDWRGGLGQELKSRMSGVVGANAEAIVPLLFGDPKKALSVLRNAEEAVKKQRATPTRGPAITGNLGGLLGSGVFR